MVQRVNTNGLRADFGAPNPCPLASGQYIAPCKRDGKLRHNGAGDVVRLFRSARVYRLWFHSDRTLVGVLRVSKLRDDQLFGRSRFDLSVLLARHSLPLRHSAPPSIQMQVLM